MPNILIHTQALSIIMLFSQKFGISFLEMWLFRHLTSHKCGQRGNPIGHRCYRMTYRLSFTNSSDLMGIETLSLLYPVRARLRPLSISASFQEGIRDRIVRVLTSQHPCLLYSLFSEFASLNLLIQENASFALKEVCVCFLLLFAKKGM